MKRRKLQHSPMSVLAMDLGGTKLACALFDGKGKILHRRIVPLEGRSGKAVGRLITSEIHQLQRLASEADLKVKAIGISVPGIAHAKTGRVWAPNIPGWRDFPLRDEIISGLRNRNLRPPHPKLLSAAHQLPVFIDSDRACCILGESWQGAAKNCQNAIFLSVGTGIGAGILAEGRILRGAHDIAGAIGWLALDRPFKPDYLDCGCFEYHASGEGLAKVARKLYMGKRPKSPRFIGTNSLTAHEVFVANENGDSIGKDVLGQAVEFWGMAVANLVSLFNPEKIIFGGGIFGPAIQFLDDIYLEAKKWAQPVSIQQVKLEASQLGSDAALYGAAYSALNAETQNDRVCRKS
jgi:glucokinase